MYNNRPMDPFMGLRPINNMFLDIFRTLNVSYGYVTPFQQFPETSPLSTSPQSARLHEKTVPGKRRFEADKVRSVKPSTKPSSSSRFVSCWIRCYFPIRDP